MRLPTRWAPLATVVAASYAFRAPSLVNAAGTNSDAAIVGLQAMHLLRGEHALFLWGSAYQTSVDAYVAAAFFAVLGPTPFALMFSALTLHVMATVAAWDTARLVTGDDWSAALLAAPLVLSTAAVHTYALYPPRQASLTLAMLALWAALRGATSSAGPQVISRWAYASGLIALLAFFADPYALLFVPVVAMLALQSFRRARPRLAWVMGAAAGALPVIVRMRHPSAAHGIFSMSTDALAHNARLLWDPCGPWALGLQAWAPAHVSDWGPVALPWPLRALQWAGIASFFAAVIGSALSLRGPGLARKVGVAGLALMALTTVGFLLSRMIFDHFAMRYLAALSFAAPLAAAPLAVRLGRRRFAVLFAPWVLAGGLCGWIGQGPFVRDGLPARPAHASGIPEQELAAALAAKGVRVGLADYWAAYRVTFVTREALTLVPLHASQDRHAAYRDALAHAPIAAYVHDPAWSAEDEAQTLAELAKDGWIAGERVESGAFRAVLLTRAQ